jgi:N-acetylglucosamine kinase-like BadF-type ATPase
MKENIFFIGIDSGGTKSELLISDVKMNTIKKNTFKSLHYSIYGTEKVADYLEDIIINTLKSSRLNLENCKGICIGLAGVREPEDKDKLKKQLSKLLAFNKILVESDSVTALYGAFKDEDGLILICGTGSILLGMINKKFIRIGGWGWKIGDFGSGYGIGKYALKHLVNEYDNKKKFSVLSSEIEKRFSINRNNILKKVYQNNFEFQNIVPLILELAEKKDKDALLIIDKTAKEIIKHLEIFFLKTGYKRKINLNFSGSILENKNVLSNKLKKSIKRKFSNINFVNKIHCPSEGAILLAKNKFDKK